LHQEGLSACKGVTLTEALPTSLRLVAVGEIGDKAQHATIGLGAQFHGALLAVVVGTRLGMMLANIPAVLIFDRLAGRLPLKQIRWFATALFILTGVITILNSSAMAVPFSRWIR
jgi:putative Ca2+/H+ antiporter (TMEM165/GDT1 family)